MRQVLALLLLLAVGTFVSKARAQLSFPPPPSPLISGNGFGFTVYSIQERAVTKLYAHPYRFVRPDPHDRYGEGLETSNLLRRLDWVHAKNGALKTQTPIVEFEADSHVLKIGSQDRYFMPFGLSRNALIAESRDPKACLSVSWDHEVASSQVVSAGGHRLRLFTFRGIDEVVAVVGLDGALADNSTCWRGDAWALLVLENKQELAQAIVEFSRWQGGLKPPGLVERELRDFESWRAKSLPQFTTIAERHLWRQSETILRMAQSREENRKDRFGHGLILASLPEGLGFVAWARDMALATVALIRSGHKAEARAALAAYFDAPHTGLMSAQTRSFPYQISTVRYFGDGTEEPFFTMEGAPNIEFDNWGLVLWALSEYVERFNDVDFLSRSSARGTVYENARDFVARPLIGNLDPFQNGWIVSSDTSIWEERQEDKKHFAFSTAAAFGGLKRFAALARLMKDEPTAKRLSQVAISLHDGFHSAYTSRGFIRGTLEESFKNDIDSAVLDAINFGLVSDRVLVEETHRQMERLRMPTGGFRRVQGETEYEKHEFLYSNFSFARNLIGLGELTRAERLVAPMVAKASLDHYLVPEMYISQPSEDFHGQVGDPTGSIPMVGYGAGIFMMYLLERERAIH